MKYCTTCTADLIEYVGFNSRAGDPSNPWDCPNKNCKPKKPTISDELCGSDLVPFNHLGGDWVSCEDCGKVYTAKDGAVQGWKCITPVSRAMRHAKAVREFNGILRSVSKSSGAGLQSWLPDPYLDD